MSGVKMNLLMWLLQTLQIGWIDDSDSVNTEESFQVVLCLRVGRFGPVCIMSTCNTKCVVNQSIGIDVE